MTKLVFATNNPHKLAEVRAMLSNRYEIVGLKDIGCTTDIPETADTFAGNALLKAQYVKKHFGLDCFSEDTGLEVDALHGAPGVFTARYGGTPRSADRNMDKLLENLQGVSQRGAQFQTAIVLLKGDETHTFTGIVRGNIRTQRSGAGGFGYDPIFEPEGYNITFAEMNKAEKARISHRGIAVRKLIAFLDKKSA